MVEHILAVSGDREIFATNGSQQHVGYSNKQVDALFDQLVVTADESEQIKIQAQIDKLMLADGEGITIFQFPAAAIWKKDRISGVEPGRLSPTMFYKFWDWKAN